MFLDSGPVLFCVRCIGTERKNESEPEKGGSATQRMA
jgi:hypothetical protein